MYYITIKENSNLGYWAAKVLNANAVAVVVGKKIHLYGVAQQAFLANNTWLRHELKHVQQYQKMGVAVFLCKYLWYSIRFGYHNNPLEKEARAAEQSAEILSFKVL